MRCVGPPREALLLWLAGDRGKMEGMGERDFTEVVYEAFRQAVYEALLESEILSEIDWEGAVVDALIRFLEADDEAEDLKRRLRKFLDDVS